MERKSIISFQVNDFETTKIDAIKKAFNLTTTAVIKNCMYNSQTIDELFCHATVINEKRANGTIVKSDYLLDGWILR